MSKKFLTSDNRKAVEQLILVLPAETVHEKTRLTLFYGHSRKSKTVFF